MSYFFFIPVKEQDTVEYRKLLEEGLSIHSKKRLPIEPLRQEVQKDLWIVHEGRPLHMCLKSRSSRLLILPEKKGVEMIEESTHVHGWLNDETDSAAFYCFSGELARFDTASFLFECNDQVRLIMSDPHGKESFGMADRLSYHPNDRTVILSSKRPHRVLFWQEGLNLSAPEVHISTMQEEVRGIGDVHFSFSLEEKNLMQEFFSKYLEGVR